MSANDICDMALELPEDQRARLAGELLVSLPATLLDEDDGLAEAKRRSAELDSDPSASRSWDEIKQGIRG